MSKHVKKSPTFKINGTGTYSRRTVKPTDEQIEKVKSLGGKLSLLEIASAAGFGRSTYWVRKILGYEEPKREQEPDNHEYFSWKEYRDKTILV